MPSASAAASPRGGHQGGLGVARLVRIALWVVFAAAVAGMAWWSFLWPVVTGAAADGPAARVGCIATLLAFLAALAGLLFLRGWRGGAPKVVPAGPPGGP